MKKEKRVKHEYEAIGPVPNVFRSEVREQILVPFQRMDTGATVWMRVRNPGDEDLEGDIIRFNGTLERGLHDGEAISGEGNARHMVQALDRMVAMRPVSEITGAGHCVCDRFISDKVFYKHLLQQMFVENYFY